MGTLDDFNRRTLMRNLGAPVTPATNVAEAAADMAAEAQARSRQPVRSAGISQRAPVSHSFAELLVVLAVSAVVAVLGLAAAAYVLPDDFSFLGVLMALAGAIFGLFAAFYLLKKAAGVFFEWLLDAIASVFRRRK